MRVPYLPRVSLRISRISLAYRPACPVSPSRIVTCTQNTNIRLRYRHTSARIDIVKTYARTEVRVRKYHVGVISQTGIGYARTEKGEPKRYQDRSRKGAYGVPQRLSVQEPALLPGSCYALAGTDSRYLLRAIWYCLEISATRGLVLTWYCLEISATRGLVWATGYLILTRGTCDALEVSATRWLVLTGRYLLRARYGMSGTECALVFVPGHRKRSQRVRGGQGLGPRCPLLHAWLKRTVSFVFSLESAVFSVQFVPGARLFIVVIFLSCCSVHACARCPVLTRGHVGSRGVTWGTSVGSGDAGGRLSAEGGAG
eukprot:138426-Rhodomonas_salina.2